jgi:glutathione-independent formaldehyde dehydrogenase
MKAVVLTGTRAVEVREVPDATIVEPTDILMRVTSTAICGTDLHFYDGRMPYAGHVIGHEPLGIVEEVGSAVTSLKKGDRIVVPTHICCGFCVNCWRGDSGACLTTNPGKAGAAYGYPNQGDYTGADAELVRVPFGDANAMKLPGEARDAFEHDFVMLADALPTGYHATELAQVGSGDSVVIFGAGAVGLCALLAARLRGASTVYVVDSIAERLQKAEELGGVPIDYLQGDCVEQIMEHRRAVRAGSAYRGERVMDGVMCGIDAVGFQARARDDYAREDPAWIIAALAELVNPTGRIAIIGVFPPKDPEGVDRDERAGKLTVPWATLFNKGISVGFGRDQDKRYDVMLRNLIVEGRLRPGKIVSHRLPFAAAPQAFRAFDERSGGYTKVVLDPTAR